MVLRHLADGTKCTQHSTQKTASNEALEILGLLAKTLLGASVLSIGNSLHDTCFITQNCNNV